nr:MAG TPA: hypothetical protein [Caudoviricetes sp.]
MAVTFIVVSFQRTSKVSDLHQHISLLRSV